MEQKKATPATRVMLRNVRLAFPVLNKPEQFQGQGEARYSATLLIPKLDKVQLEAIDKAMFAACEAKWEKKAKMAYDGLRASLKTALVDGNTKLQYQGFEGNMSVAAHSKATVPPKLLDNQRNELPRDTGVIYPGCYVNAQIEFWGQDNKYGKRINAQILAVQFWKNGDSFGAGGTADIEEFDVAEGVEAGDFEGATEAATSEFM